LGQKIFNIKIMGGVIDPRLNNIFKIRG